MNDIAEVLMIDIKFLSSSLLDKKNLNTDTFIIFFGKIHSVKTITINLINYFFEHTLTGSNQDSEHYKFD